MPEKSRKALLSAHFSHEIEAVAQGKVHSEQQRHGKLIPAASSPPLSYSPSFFNSVRQSGGKGLETAHGGGDESAPGGPGAE